MLSCFGLIVKLIYCYAPFALILLSPVNLDYTHISTVICAYVWEIGNTVKSLQTDHP